MADVFKLRIVEPDGVFYEGNASMVELTTTAGQIGVYAGHIPTTLIIAPGVLKIHEADQVKKASLMSGFIEILPETVTIMAEVAEWPEEIDAKRAERPVSVRNGVCRNMHRELIFYGRKWHSNEHWSDWKQENRA